MRRIGRTLEIYGSNQADVLQLSANAGLYQLESNLPLSAGSANPDTTANANYVELIERSETDFVIVWLGDGADQFNVTSGVDLVVSAYAGEGDDQLSTSSAGAFFYGEAGQDRLTGGPRNDWLDGGAESDLVEAGGGHDKIVMQDWLDLVNGGAGYDEVVAMTGVATSLSPMEKDLGEVEFIDLSTASSGRLQVSPNDVATITDDINQLHLRTDDYQGVELDPSWSIQAVSKENDLLSRVFNREDVELILTGPLEPTNPVNPMDTNNDDLVTASDVILIINRLDSGFIHGGSFPDVNGNGMTTAHDALLVINDLDRRSSSAGMDGAEGEFTVPVRAGSIAPRDDDAQLRIPSSLPNEHEDELISEITELLARERTETKLAVGNRVAAHQGQSPIRDAESPRPDASESDCQSLDSFFSDYQQSGGKLDIDLFE